MKRYTYLLLLGLLLQTAALHSQTETPEEAFKVRLHLYGQPDHLLPYVAQSHDAQLLKDLLFQPLLEIDPQTLALRPVLAESRPRIQYLKRGPYAGGIALHYSINSKATWDNGKPITAEDYLFTIKYIKLPLSHTEGERSYFEFIDSVAIHSNPQKFTVYFKEPYFLAEYISGSFILPKYVYDPDNVLNDISISALNDSSQLQRIRQNTKLRIMAGHAAARIVKPAQIRGSGPYELVEWQPEKIVLKRKSDWWGNRSVHSYLQAIPDYLEYHIIPHKEAAVTAFRLGKLDVVSDIPASDFRTLQNLYEMREKAQFFNPKQFAYHYLGFNMRHPFLKEQALREAFRHLIDREVLISDFMLKMAKPVDGPISPYKPYYAEDLPSCQLDLVKAKALLEEAGWEDSDGDALRDKEIDGQRQPLRLRFFYNQGNGLRKQIGEHLQHNAQKLGIDIQLQELPFNLLLDSLNQGSFDLFCLARVQGTGPRDLKPNWHSSSIKAGNYIGFSDSETDRLMEQIRITPTEKDRHELYVELQRRITAQCPQLFLFTPMGRLLVSQRLEVPFISSIRPGVDPKLLKLKEK